MALRAVRSRQQAASVGPYVRPASAANNRQISTNSSSSSSSSSRSTDTAGTGNLTVRLLPLARRVVAMDIDGRMVAEVQRRCQSVQF
ncbi:hypothetical protein Emed_001071 [Eimeria media]